MLSDKRTLTDGQEQKTDRHRSIGILSAHLVRHMAELR